MTASLRTQSLVVGFTAPGRAPAVVAGPIDVELRPGELACLVGPNGAGKSTLLRTLAGMQAPLQGHVRLNGDDLQRLRPTTLARRLAVVLTERVDVGNLSAFALTALGRHPYTDWTGALSANDETVVRRALAGVGAAGLAARPVSELSDGERQKVMIARALAQEPEVLILDEPTAFLDLPRRVEILQLLHRLARETRTAIVLSTHDLDLALRVADRLWLMPSNGALLTGLPEQLALNGSLAAAFQGEGVEFDPALGAFRIQRQPCGPIGLAGEGAAALWTARALERLGFEVVAEGEPAPALVGVSAANGAARWSVTAGGRRREFDSLAEMVEAVTRGP